MGERKGKRSVCGIQREKKSHTHAEGGRGGGSVWRVVSVDSPELISPTRAPPILNQPHPP